MSFGCTQPGHREAPCFSEREFASKRLLKRGSLKTLAGSHRLCPPTTGGDHLSPTSPHRRETIFLEVFLVTATLARTIAHLVCANAFIPLIGTFIHIASIKRQRLIQISVRG